ncbi:MAG: hypothetical protein QXR53_05060 [Candidatus Norongarragalinales archaeon]
MATTNNSLILSPATGTATGQIGSNAAQNALLNYLATQNAVGTSSTASGAGAGATATGTGVAVLNSNVTNAPIAGGITAGQLPTAAQTNFQFGHVNSSGSEQVIIFGSCPAVQNLALLAYRAAGGLGASVVPSLNARAYYNLNAILAFWEVNIGKLVLNSNLSLVAKTMYVATAGLGTNVQDASATPTFTDQSYNNVNAVMAENFSMPVTVGLAIPVADTETLQFNFMITPLMRQLMAM